jgi:ParB/RepB/Spo0J family partition protein
MTLAAIERKFLEIPLALIDEPVLVARSAMDDVALEELAADITKNGVISPLSVVWVNDRRWHASRRAGLANVPCMVYPTKTAALEGVKHAENRFREELSPADEAIFFSELLDQECGGDVDRLCALVGEKRGYVEGRLSLFKGDLKVFEALQAKRITIGVAQQLNRCPDELQRRSYLHSAIVGGATVAVVSGWVQQWELTQRQIANVGGVIESTPVPAPIPQDDPFLCEICRVSEHVHCIKHIPVHDYCYRAVLVKLLQAYRGDTPATPDASDPRRI